MAGDGVGSKDLEGRCERRMLFIIRIIRPELGPEKPTVDVGDLGQPGKLNGQGHLGDRGALEVRQISWASPRGHRARMIPGSRSPPRKLRDMRKQTLTLRCTTAVYIPVFLHNF